MNSNTTSAINSANMQRLKDRVAIVTGASSGIGAAVAEAFAREGAQVVIDHLGESACAEALSKRITSGGGKAIVVEADVSHGNDVRQMVERTHDAFGTVDILVNNAGIYPRDDWDSMTEEKWRRVIDVNLTGCYLCSHAVSADMKTAQYGKIINVSSIAFVSGMSLVHYGSSKAGVVGFTRSLACVFGAYNVCVNAILPGAIRVEREKELDSAEKRSVTERKAIAAQCIKRRGTPKDTVGAFIFFASHESDWITGHCLSVDAGYTRY